MNFDLPEGWSLKTLSDCCLETISYGIVQPGTHDDNGIPVVRVNNFTKNGLELSDVLRVSQSVSDKYKRTVLKGGEVLLTLVGSTGQSVVVPNSMAGWNVPRAIAVLRVSDDIGAEWVNCCLQSPIIKHFLDARANTTVQKTLNLKDVKDIPIPVPPTNYKKQALGTLVSLAKKLDNNRQINQTLEAMAQAIFKSWFVDFDPVKAKMNGEQPEGMDDTTALLFPEKLVDTEVGELPEGWRLVAVGELLDKTIGGDWGKEEPDEKHTEEVRIVRGTDIPKLHSGAIESVPVRYVESKKLKTRKLERGDIVIEVSGGSKDQPTGRSLFISDNILKRLELPSEPASFCRRFKPKSYEIGLLLAVHFRLMYQAGKTWEYQNQSTGISNFQTKYFLEAEHIVIPSDDVLDAFVKQVSPMMDMIHSNQNIELAKLRDTLLPKLLSGEIELETAKEQ